MIIEDRITESNFLLVAMHHYDNSQCTNLAEFEEDLKRFGYLKKLFARYKESGVLKERLILNHLIVLFNLFGVITVELLFFKIDRDYWDTLVTFLIYLNRMPEEVPEFGIRISDFRMDPYITTQLRNI
jgi:hypothetical protein